MIAEVAVEGAHPPEEAVAEETLIAILAVRCCGCLLLEVALLIEVVATEQSCSKLIEVALLIKVAGAGEVTLPKSHRLDL